MRILHDIANTIKHKNLRNPKVEIIRTNKHKGDYSSGFSKGYNVSRLEVYLADDLKIDVDDLVKLAIGHWQIKLELGE